MRRHSGRPDSDPHAVITKRAAGSPAARSAGIACFHKSQTDVTDTKTIGRRLVSE